MNTAERELASKVPEVTLVFWIIKILATTLGETGGMDLSRYSASATLLALILFCIFFSHKPAKEAN